MYSCHSGCYLRKGVQIYMYEWRDSINYTSGALKGMCVYICVCVYVCVCIYPAYVATEVVQSQFSVCVIKLHHF